MANPFSHQEDTVSRCATADIATDTRCPLPVGHRGTCPMPTEHVTETIPASELRPGDVVLNATGGREFAAFDTDFDADRMQYVTVWTSQTDQDAGIAPRLHLVPIAPVTVRRRIGGPRVTRTTLAAECSACLYTAGHTSWCPNR